MVQLAASLLVVIASLAAVAVLVALAAALLRKWPLFRKCLRVALFAALGVVLSVCLLVYGAVSLDADTAAESKAALLARGISEGMNSVAYTAPVVLAAALCWVLVKRRAR